MGICKQCRLRHRRCSKTGNPDQLVCTECEQRGLPCSPAELHTSNGVHKKMSNAQRSGAHRPNPQRQRNVSRFMAVNTVTGIVQKILVALDPGTSFCKGAFKVFYRHENTQPRMGGEDNLINKLHPVTWPNNQPHVPTCLAYAPIDGPEQILEQLWGEEVSEALRLGLIRPSDVIKYFKPVLLARDKADARRVQEQISNLPSRTRQISDGPNGETRGLKPSDLFSNFLGHAYRHILRRIGEENPELQWPSWDDRTRYRDFDPSRNIVIEVAIPLPVNSPPEHVRMVLNAARDAGIPNAYPVAEPAAALAYHYQAAFERTKESLTSLGKCVLILDVGGGSADLQIWSVSGTNPFRIHEVIKGKTSWCGGRFVNRNCRTLTFNGFNRDLPFILESLADNGNAMSPDELGNVIEDEFEYAKRRFQDQERGTLLIKGLPKLPAARMIGGGKLVLSAEDMKTTFSATITQITNMISSAILEVKEQNTSKDREYKINEILLVGGGTSGPYLRDSIRRAYDLEVSPIAGYRIPVRIPSDQTAAFSTTVAFGSLLSLADKAFVDERIIRRGYCVIWDKLANEQARNTVRPPNLVRDPHDNEWRLTDVSKFLIRPGQRIRPNHEERVRTGWRGLWLDESGPDGRCIYEQLFYSDTVSKDDEWVEEPGIGIHRMPSPLAFVLSDEDCAEFRVREHPISGRSYYYVEYEVGVIVKNEVDMIFEIIIPRSGNFDEPDHDVNPIRQKGRYDCSGVFQLFNSAS